jgi:hypothetical protein
MTVDGLGILARRWPPRSDLRQSHWGQPSPHPFGKTVLCVVHTHSLADKSDRDAYTLF